MSVHCTAPFPSAAPRCYSNLSPTDRLSYLGASSALSSFVQGVLFLATLQLSLLHFEGGLQPRPRLLFLFFPPSQLASVSLPSRVLRSFSLLSYACVFLSSFPSLLGAWFIPVYLACRSRRRGRCGMLCLLRVRSWHWLCNISLDRGALGVIS